MWFALEGDTRRLGTQRTGCDGVVCIDIAHVGVDVSAYSGSVMASGRCDVADWGSTSVTGDRTCPGRE